MRRKAQRSNNNFMKGTLVLGILVIGIVVLFTTIAYKMSNIEQDTIQQQKDNYHFQFAKEMHGNDIDIYLNDELIYSGIISSSTEISHTRTEEENAIILIDRPTDRILNILPIEGKRGHYTLSQNGIVQSE